MAAFLPRRAGPWCPPSTARTPAAETASRRRILSGLERERATGMRDYGVRVVAGELDGAEHRRLAELEQQLRRPAAAAAVESDECDCIAVCWSLWGERVPSDFALSC